MPLVIVCGRPGVGKTTFANKLAQHLKDKGHVVDIVNEESLHISKADGYKDTRSEKMTRGALMSAVERLLASSRIVIADSLNYIKGYRYQLYCLARQTATTHCVVLVEDTVANATARNKARSENEAYPEEILNDLWSRFETPDERNRWDSPLFRVGLSVNSFDTGNEGFSSGHDRDLHGHLMYGSAAAQNKSASVGDRPGEAASSFRKTKSAFKPAARLKKSNGPSDLSSLTPQELAQDGIATETITAPTDDVAKSNLSETEAYTSEQTLDSASNERANLKEDNKSTEELEKEQFVAIARALTTGQQLKPPRSTVKVRESETNFLHHLDAMTSEAASQLCASLPSAVAGDMVHIPHATKPVFLRRKITVAEVRRLRKQFLKLTSVRPPSSLSAVGNMFADYITANI